MSVFGEGERLGEQLRFGELLVRHGCITAEQLAVALEEHRRSLRPLGGIVVEFGYASAAAVAEAVASELGGARTPEDGFAAGFLDMSERPESGRSSSAAGQHTPPDPVVPDPLRIVTAPPPAQPEAAHTSGPPPADEPGASPWSLDVSARRMWPAAEPLGAEIDVRGEGASRPPSALGQGPEVAGAVPIGTDPDAVRRGPPAAEPAVDAAENDATVSGEEPSPPAARGFLEADLALALAKAQGAARESRPPVTEFPAAPTEGATAPENVAAEGRPPVPDLVAEGTEGTGMREELSAVTAGVVVAYEQLTGVRNARAAAEKQLAAAQAEVARAREDFAAAIAERASTRDELAAIVEARDAAQKQLAAAQRELASVSEEQAAAQRELTVHRNALGALIAAKEAAQQELAQARAQLADARAELEAVEEELTASRMSFTALEAMSADRDADADSAQPRHELEAREHLLAASGEAEVLLADLQQAVDGLFVQATLLQRSLDSLAEPGDTSEATAASPDLRAEEPATDPAVPSALSPPANEQHYVFVAGAGAYRLLEFAGPPPQPGAIVELADPSGQTAPYLVIRIGRAPLPGPPFPCAYVLANHTEQDI